MLITKFFTFEASHVLPKHPGLCHNCHGHSWKLGVTIEGLVNPDTGFVADFTDLKSLVHEHIISKVDHQHLGCGDLMTFDEADLSARNVYPAAFGPHFYPSSENLIVRFAEILVPHIPSINKHHPTYRPRLHSLTINETCTSECIWTARTDFQESTKTS